MISLELAFEVCVFQVFVQLFNVPARHHVLFLPVCQQPRRVNRGIVAVALDVFRCESYNFDLFVDLFCAFVLWMRVWVCVFVLVCGCWRGGERRVGLGVSREV